MKLHNFDKYKWKPMILTNAWNYIILTNIYETRLIWKYKYKLLYHDEYKWN